MQTARTCTHTLGFSDKDGEELNGGKKKNCLVMVHIHKQILSFSCLSPDRLPDLRGDGGVAV